MTAEIALLNRSAVALAADSAVTIGGGSERSPKIFNTVNKLFTLSKYHPVGIMVYGSAQILGVPWETIIKTYRKQLERHSFAHLEDYASDFLQFLEANRLLFPASAQMDYFQALVAAFYRSINRDIQNAVKKVLEKSGKIKTAETRQIIRLEINSRFDEFKKKKNLPKFSEKFAARLRRKFKTQIKQIQSKVFQELPLDSNDQTKLNLLAGWLFVRDDFGLKGTSGVVIAGFGHKDIYPRLKEFSVEGVIENKLRLRARRDVQIGEKTDASIIPFAQSDVVRSFIDGMDSGLEELLNKFLDEVFANYPNILLNHIPHLTASAKSKAANKTKDVSKEILKKFRNVFEKFRQDTLVNPIVSTVGTLPKDELAAMAETLVNLTSFKRRFSFDAETVGGPIDVAVLSKGDGFVWIRRKHYFKAELNPNFLTNYFQDV
jgi:hypothetical protein